MKLEGKRQRHPQRGYKRGGPPSRSSGPRKRYVAVEFTARDGTTQALWVRRSPPQLARAALGMCTYG